MSQVDEIDAGDRVKAVHRRTNKLLTGTTLKARLYQYRYIYLMLLPGVLFLLIMNYLPMFGALIAFKEIDYALGIIRSPWVGLQNFRFLFATNDAWVAIRNTLAYNGAFIVTGPIFAVGLALALNELLSKRLAKIYQTLLIMPHFISFVVVSYLVYAFLATSNGYVNTRILPALGAEPVRWYLEPSQWPVILFLVNGWKTWGFGTVIYLASMSGFDPQLYEAAVMDGASRWMQIRRITIPLLLPMIMLLFILSLGRIFNADFGLFYQVPRAAGPLIPTTQVLDTFVYRALIRLGDIGMSSAAAFLQSVVGFITILSVNLITRRLKPEWSIF
jgi:putative aldouronate transport system permease protein